MTDITSFPANKYFFSILTIVCGGFSEGLEGGWGDDTDAWKSAQSASRAL